MEVSIRIDPQNNGNGNDQEDINILPVGNNTTSINLIGESVNNNNNNNNNNNGASGFYSSLLSTAANNTSASIQQLINQRGHSLFGGAGGGVAGLGQSNNNQQQHNINNNQHHHHHHHHNNNSNNQNNNINLNISNNSINSNNLDEESGIGLTAASTNNNSNGQNNFETQEQQPPIQNISNTTSARLDLPSIMRWLEHSYPFIVILLLVFLYKHRQGILMFLWQQIVFYQANQALRTQVVLQEKRNIGVLLWLILILSGNIATTYLFFGSNELWRSLILLYPSISIDIYSAFWCAILNDFMARFITMIIKAFCVIFVGHRPPHKRRAQLYTVIEVTSHLYRSILPITIWFMYLHSLHDDGEIFGSLMVGLYFTFKLANLIERTKNWFQTAKAFILREVLYGRKATMEQVAAVGDLCAICQEKMVSPIVLRCDHVFCEDCVSQWFELEKTCPLCRAAIATAGNRTHSDGTTSLLFQLF